MYFYFQYPLDLAVLGLVLTAKLKGLWVQVLAGTVQVTGAIPAGMLLPLPNSTRVELRLQTCQGII